MQMWNFKSDNKPYMYLKWYHLNIQILWVNRKVYIGHIYGIVLLNLMLTMLIHRFHINIRFAYYS